ncbi:DUF4232 domain-containing protein [Streptomyces sp. NPDC048717]|uniref:DUF4232 domain-containing protein n=1 Tax=Streptomyces sp. NPDC048717 TaxID=3154928 RepID=UPI003445CC47
MRRFPAARPALAATTPLVSALAATALFLTGCGTTPADGGRTGADGTPAALPSGTPIDDPGKDGVRVVSLSLPPAPPSPSPSPSPSRPYAVHADPLPTALAGAGSSAAYEVVNKGPVALTYTVVITFTDEDGGAMDNQRVTVRDVAPGKTVRGTVQAQAFTPRVTGAKVTTVTKVPASEAPAEAGTCPASGIRIGADDGDAAMGLRVVGLRLDNCGTRDYTVEGYPLLELLDSRREPVDGVRILHGSGEITTGLGPDEPPRRVTLRPGESATGALAWRNTTESGTPVNVPYVRVRAKTGADPVTVTPRLDLGTTGKLGVTPWKKAGQQAASGGSQPGS